jgi:hypothetical protein
MSKFAVVSLDVWGNVEEGFEVNDQWKIGTVEFDADASDEEIVNVLIEDGYLTNGTKAEDLDFDGDDSFIMISAAETGLPIFNLIKES